MRSWAIAEVESNFEAASECARHKPQTMVRSDARAFVMMLIECYRALL